MEVFGFILIIIRLVERSLSQCNIKCLAELIIFVAKSIFLATTITEIELPLYILDTIIPCNDEDAFDCIKLFRWPEKSRRELLFCQGQNL